MTSLTTTQAAQLVGVPRMRATRLVHYGLVPGLTRPGRTGNPTTRQLRWTAERLCALRALVQLLGSTHAPIGPEGRRRARLVAQLAHDHPDATWIVVDDHSAAALYDAAQLGSLDGRGVVQLVEVER
jgi:hypothetical protein